VNNLLFFNKEGYPHNFQYNKTNQCWEGKLIFDENSDQTFKTQSLHIFENVDPINFVIDSELLELKYQNNSGLTIYGESNYKNEIITNIEKVNESSEFYSKWIYGSNFHKKFPAGTVISFSGVTGSSSTDFSDDQYFTVLGVKKNAFLIITNTNNGIFNFNFVSGLTSSLNMISINDYNRNLYNDTFFQNLYNNKKFSIIDSNYNNNVVSVLKTGITYSYLNEIKLNGVKDQIFTLQLELHTERPRLLFSDVRLTNNIYLEVGKMAKNLAPETGYTQFGVSMNEKEIIFEDEFGNKLFSGYTFIVKSLSDTRYITTTKLRFIPYYQINNEKLNSYTQWNTIQFTGTTDLKIGDIIRLSGITTSPSDYILQHNREFSISNISYSQQNNMTILFTPDYIIEESGVTYTIVQKLQPHQIKSVIVESSGDITEFNNIIFKNAYCYSTSNILNLSQTYISSSTSGVTETTINAFVSKYKSTLNQYGIDAYLSKKGTDIYLSIESLYGTKSVYFEAIGYTNNNEIVSDFSLTQSGITNKYDILINEKLVDERTSRNSQNLYNNQVPTEIVFFLNADNDRFGFKLILNGNEYFTNFSVNTAQTIDSFINKYYDVMLSNGFSLYRDYNYNYSGYTLNIISDVDIYDIDIIVNILSSYKILEIRRNTYILLSGNEIRSINSNLFDIGLSTGMLVKISGSTYNQNNKEYNIINLDEYNITLSYQGVFISDTAIIYGKTREFLRKPRGEYYRDVYLRAYWEIPYDTEIDESIFFYDITGEQLKPYNNIKNLEYLGQRPLIDPTINNTVILNKEPNKDINKIYNPKFQQTIFKELNFKLEQEDSSDSYNWIPEPLEIFIGYNSNQEGVNQRVLKIEKIEKNENSEKYFCYSGYTNSGSSISYPNFIFSGNSFIYLAPLEFSFISYGFKRGQIIKFYFKDQSKKNQITFENIYNYKILDLSRNKITVDTSYTCSYNEMPSGYTYCPSGFTYFNTTGSTFYFNIEVQPIEILHCPIYGQTEIEDVRFKVNLNNVGVQSEEEVYQILYQSDIQDNAIDYTLFNKKRKEMLSTQREIYDYIGSYKSLVNILNYFGYTDLKLYEYYKNVDKSSYLYKKLHKVLIPDMFDNTVEGWHEMDFINGKYQNYNSVDKIIWKKTNLFNLAYRITDEEGNNVLIYSLEEVQYKLTKLKRWLRKNIIPISANLLDITGIADTTHTLYQDYDESNQTIKTSLERETTVVNFNYTATLNFNTDYLITVNFYVLSGSNSANNNWVNMYAEDKSRINTNSTKKINYKNAYSELLKPKVFNNLENYEYIEPHTNYNEEAPLNFSVKIKTYYLSGNTYTNPTEILVPVQYFKLQKHDLTPFTFNINKNLDPYIYIEVTTFDNNGNGLGYVNNKMFYYDEPRNYWLVNHNFDLTQMKYWQTKEIISNEYNSWNGEIIETQSSNVPLT
jgi:hypothetical protein